MKNNKVTLLGWCFRTACLSTPILLWGCVGGAHVVPELSIPRPLVDSFPITVGIIYSPELTEYVFDEKLIGQGRFIIELGGSQEQVYEKSLGAIFEELVKYESLGDRIESVAGVFVPEITSVNVGVPALTRKDFYEVWIRYKLRLLAPDGTEIEWWDVRAYGTANRRDYGNMMERSQSALMHATESALRDASTQLILLFNSRGRTRKTNNWLDTHR